MKQSSSIGSLLLTAVLSTLLACGGAPAATATTPTDNVEPDQAKPASAIPAKLTVAEFNAFDERGELRPLPMRPTVTPIEPGAVTSRGRVLADAGVISIDVCAETADLLVDAHGYVYAVIGINVAGGLISGELGNIASIQCKTQRYDLEPDQVFAHTIEITDYREFIDAALGGVEE